MEAKLEDITGITCIFVPVSDVYESVKWYQQNLGCQPTVHNEVKPGMERAILRFPDKNGEYQEAGMRQTVPAIFLMRVGDEAAQMAGSYGFTHDNGDRQAVACFITPRIRMMYERFKQNGVNIVTEIPDDESLGNNLGFTDLEGNLFEIWQP